MWKRAQSWIEADADVSCSFWKSRPESVARFGFCTFVQSFWSNLWSFCCRKSSKGFDLFWKDVLFALQTEREQTNSTSRDTMDLVGLWAKFHVHHSEYTGRRPSFLCALMNSGRTFDQLKTRRILKLFKLCCLWQINMFNRICLIVSFSAFLHLNKCFQTFNNWHQTCLFPCLCLFIFKNIFCFALKNKKLLWISCSGSSCATACYQLLRCERGVSEERPIGSGRSDVCWRQLNVGVWKRTERRLKRESKRDLRRAADFKLSSTSTAAAPLMTVQTAPAADWLIRREVTARNIFRVRKQTLFRWRRLRLVGDVSLDSGYVTADDERVCARSAQVSHTDRCQAPPPLMFPISLSLSHMSVITSCWKFLEIH